MRKVLLIICLVALSFSLIGCKKHSDIIHEAGWDREFTVRNITHVRPDDQSAFFHMENSARWLGDQRIEFFWGRNMGELNVTSVDIGRISFLLEEEKEMPTVTFVFDPLWLDREAIDSSAKRQTARILIEYPSVPNHAVRGIMIRLNRQQYTELMLAAVGQKREGH